MPRRDVRQSRMRGVDVGGDGRLQQLPQRRSVVGQRLLHAAWRTAPTPVRMRVVLRARVEGRGRVRTRHAGSGHAAPPQDVGENGGALHVLHQQRDHVG